MKSESLILGLTAAVLPILTAGAMLAGLPSAQVLLVGAICALAGGGTIILLERRTASQAASFKIDLASRTEELARADGRYQRLMTTMNDSVIIVDAHGKIIEANQAISNLLSYAPEELPGHFLPDLAPTTERQTIQDFIADAIAGGAAEVKDLMLNQQSGDAAWFDGAAVRIDDDESNSIQIMLKDITASKRQFILTEKEISFVHELSRTLPLLQDFDQMLDKILSMLSDALPFEGFALVLAEPNDTIATVCVSRDAEAGFVTEIKSCVMDILADLGDTVDSASVDFNLEFREGIAAAGETVGSQIMLPLAVVNGLAGLFSSKENAFKKEDLSLFSTMVSGISSLYIAYKSYQQVQHLSVTDSLTGLFNRRKFFEELEREVERVTRYEAPLTLIMLDLDHFKKVNDEYGHQMGDEVLKETAEILLANTRKTDVVARYGGEEFIVLLTETPLEGAAGVAKRMMQAIEETVVLGANVEIKVTASLGVAEFHEGDTVDTLIAQTDAALYRAKDNGRNRIELVTN